MTSDDLSDRLRLTDEARRQLGLLMNWREERDELPDDWPMDLDLFVLTSNVEPLLSDAEEAADRLDEAETALEVALGKMHTIASQYEVLYYDPDAGHYMIQTTENSRHHQHEDLLHPRIQLDGRKRLAEGIEHLEDVLGVEPAEELVRESGGGE